eukprot:TRINITY_DN3107_c0_g1_i4.p1 TRINITY_DN3107_c0_g1~~TRINITY_DN3107_c0_g1_i4.p1  ORF type:complete len:365 (+),score=101.88 TRINITY_DN3107_c0_g1_i4:73-1167(+)
MATQDLQIKCTWHGVAASSTKALLWQPDLEELKACPLKWELLASGEIVWTGLLSVPLSALYVDIGIPVQSHHQLCVRLGVKWRVDQQWSVDPQASQPDPNAAAAFISFYRFPLPETLSLPLSLTILQYRRQQNSEEKGAEPDHMEAGGGQAEQSEWVSLQQLGVGVAPQGEAPQGDWAEWKKWAGTIELQGHSGTPLQQRSVDAKELAQAKTDFLCWAAFTGNLDLIKRLINAEQADCNQVGYVVSMAQPRQRQGLSWSVEQKEFVLASEGVPVPPLFYAAMAGQSEVLEVLLQAGASAAQTVTLSFLNHPSCISESGVRTSHKFIAKELAQQNHHDEVATMLPSRCETYMMSMCGRQCSCTLM